MDARTELDPTRLVVGFARTLRAAGVAASPDRVQAFVEALGVLDAARAADVYWAGRVTLCGDADDVDRYDRVFDAYFGGTRLSATRRPRQRVEVLSLPADVNTSDGGDGDDDSVAVRGNASDVEVLRHADVGGLRAEQRAELHRLLALLRLRGDDRPSRRRAAAHRGPVDRQRTVRALLRAGGEPARLHRWDAVAKPRRIVLVVDVSGSMRAYAEALLRFSHAARRRRSHSEVFTIGTRLTRVTREMAHPDPDTAMAAVAAAVPDFSGGTRLGVLLKEFLDRWGQRGMARGATVVILSDGWERGGAEVLAEQMARLARLAHRIVWANPLKARAGYEPRVAGMIAALPYVDDFVEGHSLAALERLARVVAGAAHGDRGRRDA